VVELDAEKRPLVRALPAPRREREFPDVVHLSVARKQTSKRASNCFRRELRMNGPVFGRQQDRGIAAQGLREPSRGTKQRQQQHDGAWRQQPTEVDGGLGDRTSRARRIVDDQRQAPVSGERSYVRTLTSKELMSGPQTKHLHMAISSVFQERGAQRRHVAAGGPDARNEQRPRAFRPEAREPSRELPNVIGLEVEGVEARG
jgi:hypothetical protein